MSTATATDSPLRLAGELIAMIRLNVMRGTFAEHSVEQVEEHLAPWIERLKSLQKTERESGDALVDADKFLPMGPHEVLATDGEGWFLAYYQDGQWWSFEMEEPLDSEILYWRELDEIPEV